MLLWSFEGVREPRAFDSSAVIPAGKHLFPFRTEKLSLPGPMVLGGQPPGRVGRRRFLSRKARESGPFSRRQRQGLEVARVVGEELEPVVAHDDRVRVAEAAEP